MPRTTRASAVEQQLTPERDPIAGRVGARVRRARLQAGLTQQALAGERYTKAYVSALENALVKPSMIALEYLASRLGTTAGQLLADDDLGWGRLDADLRLAAGDWLAAADVYAALLEQTFDRGRRAELQRGRAEALARLEQGAQATAAASEAVDIFESLGRQADAALAGYWLSAGLYAQGNTTEAKAILMALLGQVRTGLRVEPDFKLRLLMAISSNESREGNHQTALSYLEEIRGLAQTLDNRRRAAYLFDLAYSYRETRDFEAALRTGYASLTLFQTISAELELAKLENDLALAHVATGNLARADELASSARERLAGLDNKRLLPHVIDTEAQIAAARADWPRAIELATEAVELASQANNPQAQALAMLTLAQAQTATSRADLAAATYAQAAALVRPMGQPTLLRQVLTAWADLVASLGDHARAFELTREALRAQ